jgi:signal transduction histidine kinase
VGAVLVAVGLLVVNAAVLYAVLDRVDIGIFVVQALLTLLLLVAALLHIRQLGRDRRRFALSTVLSDLAAEPSDVAVTAEAALAALLGNELAEAGLIALAGDESEEEMGVVATDGYPAGWPVEARPRALPARDSVVSVGRDQDDHPWIAPLVTSIGAYPWVARIPLHSGGNPIGLLLLTAGRPGALQDETLLERLSTQLATALDHSAMYEASYAREQRLEALDQQRRDFIGSLAHEVRTPLTSIQAFADLLQLQPAAMDETAEQLVNSLNQGVQRLNLLVNDLLDLGQSESAGFTVTPAVVELAELFGEIESLLRPAYLLREQTLAIEIGDGGAAVRADRARLEQVLLNLLSNAHRYTPLGGAVSLRTWAADGRVRIEIDDSGEGVPEHLRERVFDPYYRVDRGDATVHGSGLGLAVARQLIELQSGRIWVEDAPTGGARFCVELPRAGVGPADHDDETTGD